MAKGADPARRCRIGPARRLHFVRAGLALIILPLWASHARAQTDPDADSTAPAASQPTPSAAPAASTSPTAARSDVSPAVTPLQAPSFLQPLQSITQPNSSLRDTVTSNLAPPLERTARNWSVTPSIGVGEEYASNVLGLGGNTQGYDFITLVQPSVTASGTTTRLQGSINYSPLVEVYARNFNQSHVDENFGGSVLATLVPGTLFLDLRAFGAVTTNGVPTNSTSTANGNAETQSLSFAASPYALHRFGDLGTGEVGVSLAYSASNGVNGNNNFTTTTTTNPFFTSGNQDLTSYSGHVGFQTGEAFGRYNGTALLYASQYDGTGVLSNSARDTATIDNGYAITRLFTLLGRVGYEHIRYGGTTPLRIDDAIYDAGFRLSLGPTSTIEARYGHHDGFNALSVNAAVSPTARTRLLVSYSEGLDTDAEQLQSTLATTDFDQLGNPVDHTTGAPLLLASTGLFGAQNNLYRTKRLSVTASLLRPVDVFSASVEAEDNRLVSSSGLPNTLGNNNGVFGTLTWGHDLSPTLSLSSYGQYGLRSATGGGGTQHVVNASAALVKALSETLSAQLRYTYNHTSGGQGFNTTGLNGQSLSNYDQSLILLLATKSF